jgi:hypothetical protein
VLVTQDRATKEACEELESQKHSEILCIYYSELEEHEDNECSNIDGIAANLWNFYLYIRKRSSRLIGLCRWLLWEVYGYELLT